MGCYPVIIAYQIFILSFVTAKLVLPNSNIKFYGWGHLIMRKCIRGPQRWED